MTYKEQLAHPKWQKKRLQILERDKFTCQICLDTETQLQLHHKYYDNTYKTMAWEYPNNSYQTLCSVCHKALTKHIEEHGDEKDFAVLKIKSGDGIITNDSIYIYSKGILKCEIGKGDINFSMSDNTTYKIVQFLINNWLKNG